MMYRGVFIGVGRYLDPTINDLVGARWDALALWSLFKDNVPDLEDRLLLDTDATVSKIRSALAWALGEAGPDDVVIVTFAGHGSDDHRIVASDTVDTNFEATSIAMDELVELFGTTQARAVVCVLDCCFSGGAPARGIGGRPKARSLRNPFTALAGKGRVLLAACAIDEYAYEDPRRAHGLLTHAVLDALRGMRAPTEVLMLAGEITQVVRAEAARLGVTQNPAVLGYVEGGFTLSPFAPGLTFLQHFPDRTRLTVDGTIAGLATVGLPPAVLAAWEERFRGDLNALQVQAINEFRVLDGESLLTVAPTSSGKTFIGELAALRAILEGRKAVFLLPYRALVNEKYDEFTALITARQQGIAPQIVALSAVIGGVNHFDAWLGCRTLISYERPVPLVEGVLDRQGTFQYLDPDGHVRRKALLPPDAVVQRGQKPSAQDVIVPLVQKLIADNPSEKIIIFRNQRGSAEGCAVYLAKDLGLPSAPNILKQLPVHDPSDASRALAKALAGGTACHTANLTRDEKVAVEHAFRDPEGPVRVLAATTGVAAGLNTPASTVILAEQEFRGEDGRPFTIAEYKNMAGRAGRKGLREQGTAIILADGAHERETQFATYVLGRPEPLRSSFAENDLATWVLKLLTQVKRVRRGEVPDLLANTYGGYLRVRNNPDWLLTMKRAVGDLLERMGRLELVEAIGDDLELTLLGRACGRSNLAFGSAMRLVELLRQHGGKGLTPERLVAILQILPEADAVYTPMLKGGVSEQTRPQQVTSRFGVEVTRLLQSGVSGDQFIWLARCKRAAVLWDWMSGVDVEIIERTYSSNPYRGAVRRGSIQGFADLTRFHLRSAAEILLVLALDSPFDQEGVARVLRRLEAGLPESALGLLDLQVELTRGEYLALHRAGFAAVEQVTTASQEVLALAIGETQAQNLRAATGSRASG